MTQPSQNASGDIPEPDESHGPKSVSKFEAHLLRILRFFLHHLPPETGLPLIQQKLPEPPCISPTAMHLVRDTLAKGCVLYLVHSGAWRRDRYMRGEKLVTGRLWDRSTIPDISLKFSQHTMRFLIWITANKPGETKPFWQAPENELTVGDELFLFVSYSALRDVQDVGNVFRGPDTPFSRNALCWLAHPDDFAGNSPEAVPSFAKWMKPPYSYLLEAMQPVLLDNWLTIERSKGQIGNWDQMMRQGQVEDRVLSKFIEAAEREPRPDLVRFILHTAGQVLSANEISPTFWTGGLQGSTAPTRLADRLETQRNALALLRNLDRLHQWERRARLIGFMDEGYQAAKLWLSDWEAGNGEVIHHRAQRIVSQFDPLRVTAGGMGGTPPNNPNPNPN